MKKKKKQSKDSIWTLSNGLSAFRLVLVIPLVIALSDPYRNRWIAVLIGLVAYLSDLSDGFIARKFGKESAFGRFIDPLADKVFITGAVIILLVKGLLPLWFGIVIIMRDVIIFFSGIYLRARTNILVQSNIVGKIAVVSIGVVLVLSLFRDLYRDIWFSGAMVISLGFMTASIIVYGQRFFQLLKKASK